MLFDPADCRPYRSDPQFSLSVPSPPACPIPPPNFRLGDDGIGSGSPARPSCTATAVAPLSGASVCRVHAGARGLPWLGSLAGVATAEAQPGHDRIHAARPRTP